jgi:hypothetical protein
MSDTVHAIGRVALYGEVVEHQPSTCVAVLSG